MEALIVKEALALLLNHASVAAAVPGGVYEHPAPASAVGVVATWQVVSIVNVRGVGRGANIQQEVLAQVTVYVPGDDSTAAGPALAAIRARIEPSEAMLLTEGWWFGAVREAGVLPPQPEELGGTTWSAYGDEWRCYVQALV